MHKLLITLTLATITILHYGCQSNSATKVSEQSTSATSEKEATPTPQITYAGGNGFNYQNAVIIEGTEDEAVIEQAQTDWIAKNLPPVIVGRKYTNSHEGYNYDLIEVLNYETGGKMYIYFKKKIK